MTDEKSARFALPLLQPGQAQKEMSHNEALALIDLLLNPVAKAIGLNTPPATPAPGETWIVGANPEREWSGHAGALAGWTGGGWRFAGPVEGLVVWIEETGDFIRFTGNAWRPGSAHGRLFVEGLQVVGPRSDAIPDPAGGSIVDNEARAALAAALAALRTHGLIKAD